MTRASQASWSRVFAPAQARAREALAALALFAGTLALYAETGSFEFVAYDDPGYVTENPVVSRGITGAGARWAFTSTSYQYNWHPLTWLAHMLDVDLFGLDAGKHHLVSAGLHALNAALLFLAFRALTAAFWPSLLAAALFAVHPLRIESVAWVAERKDVLAGAFFCLTLLAYARHARSPSPGRYSLVALLLACGLLAKPTLVSVPLVLFLLDWWPLGRLLGGSRRAVFLEKLPLLGLSLASAAITLVAQHGGGAVSTGIPLGARVGNAVVAYVAYLGKALWPEGLAVFYPHPAIVQPERSRFLPILFSLLVLALASVLAWRLRRRAPWLIVGWLWYLGMLVPMIGLVQVGDQALADRYAYLPLIGITVAFSWTASELVRVRPAVRWTTAGVSAALVGACVLVSARHLSVWRDSRTLFEHALLVTDRNYVAHASLGKVLGDAGRLDEALEHFERSRAILPGFFQAQLNAGKARYKRGELDLARAAFENCVRLRPESAEAHFDLAIVLARLGDFEAADRHLAEALRLDPAYADDPSFRVARSALDARLDSR